VRKDDNWTVDPLRVADPRRNEGSQSKGNAAFQVYLLVTYTARVAKAPGGRELCSIPDRWAQLGFVFF